MHPIARAAWIVGLGLILGACTIGRQFTFPPPGTFVLGKTTPDEIIAKLGQPLRRESYTTASAAAVTAPSNNVFAAAPEPGQYQHFNYVDINTSGQFWVHRGLRPARTFECVFWNGKLVEYLGSSSFQTDSTDFDDGKVAQLQRDRSTGDQVLALFGQPSGGEIYPLVSRTDGVAMLYFYVKDDLTANQRYLKIFEVFVDKAGIVRDFRAKSTSAPLPLAPSGPATVPIVIPAGKR